MHIPSGLPLNVESKCIIKTNNNVKQHETTRRGVTLTLNMALHDVRNAICEGSVTLLLNTQHIAQWLAIER
jgi:hypothetical protein